MNNIKCQNLVISSLKIRVQQIFFISKPNIMNKSRYQQYLHCFTVCILVPHAFQFSYQQNIITILISTAFKSCGAYFNVDTQRRSAYLRPGAYQRKHGIQLLHLITLYQRRQKIVSLNSIEFSGTSVLINNPH